PAAELGRRPRLDARRGEGPIVRHRGVPARVIEDHGAVVHHPVQVLAKWPAAVEAAVYVQTDSDHGPGGVGRGPLSEPPNKVVQATDLCEVQALAEPGKVLHVEM